MVVSLATWDPSSVDLRSWLGDRIAAQYRGLAAEFGRHAPRELVAERRVLPVLDEMSEARRVRAVMTINRLLGPNDRMILTCRTAEYAAAVDSGGPVGAAAVIQAEPVAADVVAAYLRLAVPPRHLPRWQPVLDRLAEDPDGPLAGALSTPLAVWLARTIYAGPRAEPGELLDAADTEPARIPGILLDGLIPAVLTDDPPPPSPPALRRRWGSEHARRWLGFLATNCADDTPRRSPGGSFPARFPCR